MSYTHRIIGFLILLVLPVSTLADAPSVPTALKAEKKDESVLVSWAEQPGEDIEYYRVFHSFESILENNGLYDDFIKTDDATNELLIPIEDLPESDTIFFAVMAVNTNGEDSALFTEEVAFYPYAQVEEEEVMEEPETEEVVEEVTQEVTQELETPEETPEAPVESEGVSLEEAMRMLGNEEEEAPAELPTSLTLDSVGVLTPSEILITLNAVVEVEPEKAPEAIFIVDEDGMRLPIIQIVIDENLVTVTTKTQERGKVYEVHIMEPARNPDGIPLDTEKMFALFEGHPNGAFPVENVDSNPEPTPEPVEEVVEEEPEPLPPVEAQVISAEPVRTITPPTSQPLAQSGLGVSLALSAAGGAIGWMHNRKRQKRSL